jgi:hypothetical protein
MTACVEHAPFTVRAWGFGVTFSTVRVWGLGGGFRDSTARLSGLDC